jgi:prepilin-type N-terminal cleavage/methylation domain-containing protein
MLFPAKSRSFAFTLVEIMIVVSVISILATIAVPGFMRARKRSQATMVKNDLRLIDSAIAQYAMETSKMSGSTVFVDDWLDYIKEESNLYDAIDLFGNDYGDQTVDAIPYVPAKTWDLLSDVADTTFWEPFMREPTAGAPPAPHKTKKRRPRRGG